MSLSTIIMPRFSRSGKYSKSKQVFTSYCNVNLSYNWNILECFLYLFMGSLRITLIFSTQYGVTSFNIIAYDDLYLCNKIPTLFQVLSHKPLSHHKIIQVNSQQNSLPSKLTSHCHMTKLFHQVNLHTMVACRFFHNIVYVLARPYFVWPN